MSALMNATLGTDLTYDRHFGADANAFMVPKAAFERHGVASGDPKWRLGGVKVGKCESLRQRLCPAEGGRLRLQALHGTFDNYSARPATSERGAADHKASPFRRPLCWLAGCWLVGLGPQELR